MDVKEKDEIGNDWAIIISAGGKYIGKVGSKKDVLKNWMQDGFITIGEPYEFLVMNLMQPGPSGQPAIGREVRVLPLGLNSEALEVTTQPCDIWFLKDMKDRDQKKYKSLVVGARTMQNQQRFGEAGLTHATGIPKDIPPGRGFMSG